MAKINISVDTESGIYSVDVNGVALTNLGSLSISFPNEEYWGDYGPDRISFSAAEATADENDVYKMTRTCAADLGSVKEEKTGLFLKSSKSSKNSNVLGDIFKC